jgi:predicted CoA-binding protein
MRSFPRRRRSVYDSRMPGESCPLPSDLREEEKASIKTMLAAERIAIVGASDDPTRASHQIAVYLTEHGKTVIPVNPNHKTVLGLRCYPSLSVAPGPLEVVNVFRRPEFCEAVVAEAIAVGAAGIWLQSGIRNERAREIAAVAGLAFVQDRCIMVEHMRQARQ